MPTLKQKTAFKKVLDERIKDEDIIKRLADLIRDKDEFISKEAIAVYDTLTGKREKCWVESCSWRYNLHTHHIDHNRKNNKLENLIRLCPNHHYLHHNNHIKLEDLSKFS